MKNNVKGMTQAGIIACLYAVLTLIPGLSALSFGPVQLRVSEMMTLLPILTPAAIPGLTVGCLISNLLGSPMILDSVLGTAATLLAAIFTRVLRKKTAAALAMPAVFNGIIVGSMITLFYSEKAFSVKLLIINMLSVAAGELMVCFILGYPFVKILKKHNIF